MAGRRAANDPGVRVELTARHEEVLGLIAAGKTNGEIAEALGVTLDGAKWHVREILLRLGAETREEAVERWRERQSGRRRRPWAWFGWLAAAAIGVVGVVVAGAVLVAAVGSRSSEEPQPGQLASLTEATAAGLPAPTSAAPADLDPEVADLIAAAGVPLNFVSWVGETVNAEGYALTLHGVYADPTRTVAFATARPVDPEAPGVLPWVKIAYAHLTDAAGNSYEPGGPSHGSLSPGTLVAHQAIGFAPLPEGATGKGLRLRFNELAGPYSQYIYADWAFDVDVTVHPEAVVRQPLPGPLTDGDATYTVTKLEISGHVVTLEWESSSGVRSPNEGPPGVARGDAGVDVSLWTPRGDNGARWAAGGRITTNERAGSGTNELW